SGLVTEPTASAAHNLMGGRKEDSRHLLRECFVVPLLFLVLAGCKERPKQPPPPPPKVTVAQAVQRTVTDHLELTGNAQAVYTVNLGGRVAGFLEKVLFQDGKIVKKAQPLFLIEQDTYRHNLQQAEASVQQYRAQLVYAEAQFARYSNLV